MLTTVSRCVPWLFIVSDGGGDETHRHLGNLVADVLLMKHLDLTGLLKLLTPPLNSKMNVVEMLNRSIACTLRNQCISDGNGTRLDLDKAVTSVAELLKVALLVVVVVFVEALSVPIRIPMMILISGPDACRCSNHGLQGWREQAHRRVRSQVALPPGVVPGKKEDRQGVF